jgi:hypothetical protein
MGRVRSAFQTGRRACPHPRPTALERHLALVLEVFGQPHRGHATLAELALDRVAVGHGGDQAFGEGVAHGRMVPCGHRASNETVDPAIATLSNGVTEDVTSVAIWTSSPRYIQIQLRRGHEALGGW